MEEVKFTVVVGKEGRIVIPHKIREEHEIKEGDPIRVISYGSGHKIELELLGR